MLVSDSRAQGTIEYLVIIAVVVVLALFVVAMLVNQTSASGNVSSSVGKIGALSQGLSVSSVVSDPRGDAVLSLTNNSGGNITLTKITPIDSKGNAGSASSFSTPIVQGSLRNFSLSDINSVCSCSSGETTKTCAFKITVVNADTGLEKEGALNVTTNCTTDSNPRNPELIAGLGSGTLASPWEINNCLELQRMSSRLDGNYVLGADLNCWETRNWNAGFGFASVGNDSTAFTGSFNGNSHTITSLYINRPATDYVGLFGYTTGNISNIGLIDVNVTGAGRVGGLSGYLMGPSGTVTSSYASGIANGSSDHVGVLIGRIGGGGTLNKSYSAGRTIVASGSGMEIGGLVGSLGSGTISNSYSTANVSATSNFNYVGGFAGASEGATIINSYSTGTITGGVTSNVGGFLGGHGTETNCFWDMTTSGRATSAGSEVGKTTAQMKQQATFTGWNFTTIWNIIEATSYPYLR